MSVMPSEARAPDESTSARGAAGQAAQAAGNAASNVAGTAKEQASRVTTEASAQARNVASQVKGKVSDQARTQNDKIVDGIRRMADELEQMKSDRQDSPASAVVSRVADGGRQVADYLANNGPDGVLREVQEFARRRPGAFLATALTAGFVVGRLGKGVLNAADAQPDVKPPTDTFVSTPPVVDPLTDPAYSTGYVAEQPYGDTGTQYAATGTGTPIPVTDPYDAPLSDPAFGSEQRYDTEAGFESRPR
jgi:uncharacterized protein YjbJ (UPF0337 family)